jgi:hypothetical protein
MPPSVVHPASKALRHATASNRPRVEDFARMLSPSLLREYSSLGRPTVSIGFTGD